MTKLLNTGLAIILVSLAMSINIAVAQAPMGVEIIRIPSESELVDFYADKWGVSRVIMHKVINCESGYNAKAVNMSDVHRFSKGSHGIAQFSMETFNTFSKKIGIENGNPYDTDDALDTMGYMLKSGLGKHWTCYNKLI